MADVLWDRKAVLVGESIQQGTTAVYSKTLKNSVEPFRTKDVEC
jgi:hypothetical protein